MTPATINKVAEHAGDENRADDSGPNGERPFRSLRHLVEAPKARSFDASGDTEHRVGMKRKGPVTLEAETVDAINEISTAGRNRSLIIEEAVIEHLERHGREAQVRRDVEILNRHAERLNREVEAALQSQAEP